MRETVRCWISRGILTTVVTLSWSCGDDVDSPLQNNDAPTADQQIESWFESFDTRESINATTFGPVEVDSNLGQLRLISETLPIASTSTVELDNLEAMERIDGASITLPSDEILTVADSLELVAASKIHINGNLQAGDGGLLIAAGDVIQIAGALETTGPIQIYILNPGGIVDISGTIRGTSLEVLGRGQVILRGITLFETTDDSPIPHITINTYEDIILSSNDGIYVAPEGAINLVTSKSVTIPEQGFINSHSAWFVNAREFINRGNITADNLTLNIKDLVQFRECSKTEITGDILRVYSPVIHLGRQAEVFGSNEHGTQIMIEASERLVMQHASELGTSSTFCSPDSSVSIKSPLCVGDSSARLGQINSPGDCQISVEFEDIADEQPQVEPRSSLALVPKTDINLSNQHISNRVSGYWESKPIYIGQTQAVSISDFIFSTPEDTRIELQLGFSSAETDVIDSYTPSDGGHWTPPANHPWMVVRIVLEGLIYDAPTVDLVGLSWQ